MTSAVQAYLEAKHRRALEVPQMRAYCAVCLQPCAVCYCSQIQKFDPGIEFVILIHPLERRRRIATGRMSHFCLAKSHLVLGYDYTENQEVNDLINDPKNHSVILYPGPQSTNLSGLSPESRNELFPREKNLVVFVIDGTWGTASKTLRYSRNLSMLPRVCFTPKKPSNFRVRKQPAPECYSTLEAIHETIELLGDTRGFKTQDREHDRLLHAFNWMVEKQLASYKSPILRRIEGLRKRNV